MGNLVVPAYRAGDFVRIESFDSKLYNMADADPEWRNLIGHVARVVDRWSGRSNEEGGTFSTITVQDGRILNDDEDFPVHPEDDIYLLKLDVAPINTTRFSSLWIDVSDISFASRTRDYIRIDT